MPAQDGAGVRRRLALRDVEVCLHRDDSDVDLATKVGTAASFISSRHIDDTIFRMELLFLTRRIHDEH